MIIDIGERIKIKEDKGYTTYLTYCGMPHPETFCLQKTLEHIGRVVVDQHPLYYPSCVKNIKISSMQFKVIGVNPERITLDRLENKVNVER